jgi:hypothetical protein
VFDCESLGTFDSSAFYGKLDRTAVLREFFGVGAIDIWKNLDKKLLYLLQSITTIDLRSVKLSAAKRKSTLKCCIFDVDPFQVHFKSERLVECHVTDFTNKISRLTVHQQVLFQASTRYKVLRTNMTFEISDVHMDF